MTERSMRTADFIRERCSFHPANRIRARGDELPLEAGRLTVLLDRERVAHDAERNRVAEPEIAGFDGRAGTVDRVPVVIGLVSVDHLAAFEEAGRTVRGNVVGGEV